MSTLSTLEANSLKGALEALLLVSSDPVSAPALAGALDIAPGECASLLAELKGVDDLKFMLISLIVDQRNQLRPVFLVFQISHKQCTPFRVCRVLFTVT